MIGLSNMYFHLSGEIQGQLDRSPTHADEGFRGIDQNFVDRLNEAVRNEPILRERSRSTPWTSSRPATSSTLPRPAGTVPLDRSQPGAPARQLG